LCVACSDGIRFPGAGTRGAEIPMATVSPFLGPAAFKFLRELAAHNDKAWFDANKARFEAEVKAPALALIEALVPVVRKVSPHILVDTRPHNGSLSRMNRDVRFSKDKTPYKTALFIHFKHAKASEEGTPALFLHVEPGASTAGGGVWRPGPVALKRIRDAIVETPAAWKKAQAAGVKGACAMAGESLKRVPPGYDADHAFAEDLKRKDFGLHRTFTDAEVSGPKAVDAIRARFEAVAPMLSFLCRATGVPF